MEGSLDFFLRTRDSEFRLLPVVEHIPPGVITENSEVTFHLRGKSLDIFSTNLRVDGLELDRVALASDHLMWRWHIGFHAGLVEVDLRIPGRRAHVAEIVTDPVVAKMSRSDFTTMIGDILADTLALASITGHRIGVARGDRIFDLGRLHLIQYLFPRFVGAIEEIDRKPWLRVDRVACERPLAMVRQASALEVSRSVGRRAIPVRQYGPAIAQTAKALGERMGGYLPARLRTSKAVTEFRRREHADILSMIRVWRSFLVRVYAALERITRDAPESDPRIDLWRRKVASMRHRLEDLSRLPLFDGITPTLGPISDSHLFRAVGPYRTAYRCFRSFLAGISDVVGDFLKLPLRKTYDLYELWCFLRLARAAAVDADPTSSSWRNAFKEVSGKAGLVREISGRPLDFGGFRLIYQPLYREVWAERGPRVGSFSRVMQPDIAIAGSLDAPIIVLDAKYRIENGLNDAIASIHTYRDALVERVGESPALEVRRAVRAAFVLTPQVLGDGANDWQRSSTPAVFFRQGYRDTFRFGAITVRPGMTIPAAKSLLEELVDLAKGG